MKVTNTTHAFLITERIVENTLQMKVTNTFWDLLLQFVRG